MFVDKAKHFSLKYAWKLTLFNIFVTRVYLTVCYYHVTCTFQSESTLYSCLNVKDLSARNRHGIYLSVRWRTTWLWVGILMQPLGFIFDECLAQRRMTFFVLYLFFTEVCQFFYQWNWLNNGQLIAQGTL